MRGKRRGKTSKKLRSGPGTKSTGRGGLAVACSSRQSSRKRIAALAGLSQAVCDDAAKLKAVLNLLRDEDAPIAVRLAALQTIQAASFSTLKFESCRPEYLRALRSVATDKNIELRQRALGLLARERDGYAQKLLLEGLQNPKKALVPPEKALQLLSYDVHAEAYPVARKIVQNPPNPAAKREALRVLAADAASAPVFEKILRDKKESPAIRQLSASALQSLAPKKLQAHARAMVLDESEDNQVKATSLTALTYFGEKEAVAKDDVLKKRVDTLRRKVNSAGLKRQARRFLSKYR